MGAHDREAQKEHEYQLAKVVFPFSFFRKPTKYIDGAQNSQNTPDITRRTRHGKIQIRHQVKQDGSQQHIALFAAAEGDQQRGISGQCIENKHTHAGKGGLVIGVAELPIRMEQAVAEKQLQRGEVAVASVMADGFLFIQQNGKITVLAVIQRQRHIFSGIGTVHGIHTAHEPHAGRQQQQRNAHGKAQHNERGLVKNKQLFHKAKPLHHQLFGPAQVQNAQNQHNQAAQRRQRTDINQLGCLRPEQRQQQRPQVLHKRRNGHAGQKTGRAAALHKPAVGGKQAAQRAHLHQAAQQIDVTPAIVDIQPFHQPFLPAFTRRSISCR